MGHQIHANLDELQVVLKPLLSFLWETNFGLYFQQNLSVVKGRKIETLVQSP
jgi:hypothetical protein